MDNIKHIHEVLFLFQRTGGYNDVKEMETDIKANLGEDVRFVSCSDTPFGIDEVVPFLTSRNKIIVSPDGSLRLHPEMTMCNGHEDGHHHDHNH